MPYVDSEVRDLFDQHIADIVYNLELSNFHPGNINYVVSKLMSEVLRRGVSYRQINDLIGTLECVKLELYREVASGYEDDKKQLNGPVYVR
jgi:hypothetical protein